MEETIPTELGDEFLEWFRDRTEVTWAKYPVPTLERFAARRMHGCDWQPGTRWLGGISEGQIAEVERRRGLHFPPDYRLFLRRLHAIDRPMRCTEWDESATDQSSKRILRDSPAFYNWLTDGKVIHERLDTIVEGLQFDVESNDLWRPGWGTRLPTPEARAERVRELVAAAPRLIPVYSHRYLLAEPCRAGNPVLSIMQSDIVVYGAELRSYFLSEFAELLGIDRAKARQGADDLIQAHFDECLTIPFWGELL